jgi:hypothetical protein
MRRKPGRGRSSLLTSGEKLHTRLTRIEELQGSREQRTYVFMPRHAEMKPAAFPEGEAPQRGDLVIFFEPLHATAEEAAMSLQEFGERYRQKTDLAPVALPWKRDLGQADPPPRSDPDPELETFAEDRKAPDIRPLDPGEMREAADRLMRLGHLFSRSVTKSALGGGEVPLADEALPRAEFCSSSGGTLLIRIWRHAADSAKPRQATGRDREQWPAAFRRFLAQCSPTFTTTNDEDD